ncbi:hypothetical protein K445DRAFT_317111 [Daldinia sp. EC12]|nr:hypothetical protein K445DRAFT_317111 [Daldinia sp. EC12]
MVLNSTSADDLPNSFPNHFVLSLLFKGLDGTFRVICTRITRAKYGITTHACVGHV